jgi:hypothetical protein
VCHHTIVVLLEVRCVPLFWIHPSSVGMLVVHSFLWTFSVGCNCSNEVHVIRVTGTHVAPEVSTLICQCSQVQHTDIPITTGAKPWLEMLRGATLCSATLASYRV